MIILGMDIGGANTKAALLEYRDNNLFKSFSYTEYFPFWEKETNQINEMLNRIISKIIRNKYKLDDIGYISIAITAELSDAFQTKAEGMSTILNSLSEVFERDKLKFVCTDKEFLSYKDAKANPYKIAAANWVSTSLFLGHFKPNCILIDAGSTTIDIIPIHDSAPITIGTDDLGRLLNHELIYTGGLRATIPSITHFVPYKDQKIRISFEKFALISDVHRILNNISDREYITDTADNRSKSLENCYARLARMICADLNMVSKQALNYIAQFIYKKQLKLIEDEINQFLHGLYERFPEFKKNEPEFIITGLSAAFLIKKILEDLGFQYIYKYEDITKIPDYISSSAYAVAGALYFQLKESGK